jgi:hypothetical protein
VSNPCPPFDEAPEAVRAYVEEAPCCTGEWLAGSGGHRHHGACSKPATWWSADDPYAYCDEHVPEMDREMYADDWARVRSGTWKPPA